MHNAYIVRYHGNHFLSPIFLGSESGCHGNTVKLCHYILYFASASPWQNIDNNGTVRGVTMVLRTGTWTHTVPQPWPDRWTQQQLPLPVAPTTPSLTPLLPIQ